MDAVKISRAPDYVIYRDGTVRRIGGDILKPYMAGYPTVSLNIDKKACPIALHILLGIAFIPNPEQKSELHHLDEDKTNYDLINLVWVTRKEHIAYHRTKAVDQFKLDGEYVASFASSQEAADFIGCSREAISSCARGTQKTAFKYLWRYV